LCRVKGLLRGITKQAIAFALQCRKVKEFWRGNDFLLFRERNANGLPIVASRLNFRRFLVHFF
jgi:hypothetical protein